MNKLKFLLAIIFLSLIFRAGPVLAQEVSLYFFYGEGCPHCAEEEEFLATLPDQYPEVEIIRYETYNDPGNANLLKEIGKSLDADVRGVPVTFINDEYVGGFYDADLTGTQIKEKIDKCLAGNCSNQIAEIISSFQGNQSDSSLVWYTLGGTLVLVVVVVFVIRKLGKQ
ncbi:MAG: glutaredoxin [Patescibacteria group bacterium]